MDLSIVVPCYNEADNLPLLLQRFRDVLHGLRGIEVVLVDNGSKDDSGKVLAEHLARPENRFARVVSVSVNQGYGFGILSGLRQSAGTYLAWTHADMQTDPHDVLLGYQRLCKQPHPERCLLRGRRRGRQWLDGLCTFGMGVIASLLLRSWLFDINAQPKVFHRSLLDHLADAPWDFSLDLYVLQLAHRRKLRILEQPVDFAKRVHGEAKGGGTLKGKIRLTRRTLAYILQLSRRLSA